MGGGIILQYAWANEATNANGYLLFAPHLGHDAPRIPKTQPAEDGAVDNFIKIHFEHMVGLQTLNASGITEYNHLPVIFLNLPKEAPLHRYSYRAHLSMAPNDYKAALKAIDKPLFVLVGSEDEAFVASVFDCVISNNSKGEFHLIENATHNGVRHNEEALRLVSTWIKKYFN